MPLDRIPLTLGQLEGEQYPAADLQCVLEALETGRERLPLLVPEVGVVRTGGHDQVVVPEGSAVAEPHHPLLHVHVGGLGQEHLRVLLATEHRSDRRGDVARVERGRGHLVEHRLEQVVVAAVHHRYPDRRAAQPLGGIEPGEPSAENHHMRYASVAHSAIVSLRQRANRTTSSAGGTARSSAYAVYILQRR